MWGRWIVKLLPVWWMTSRLVLDATQAGTYLPHLPNDVRRLKLSRYSPYLNGTVTDTTFVLITWGRLCFKIPRRGRIKCFRVPSWLLTLNTLPPECSQMTTCFNWLLLTTLIPRGGNIFTKVKGRGRMLSALRRIDRPSEVSLRQVGKRWFVQFSFYNR